MNDIYDGFLSPARFNVPIVNRRGTLSDQIAAKTDLFAWQIRPLIETGKVEINGIACGYPGIVCIVGDAIRVDSKKLEWIA